MQQDDLPPTKRPRQILRWAVFIMAYAAAAGAVYGGKYAVDWLSMTSTERLLIKEGPELAKKAEDFDRELGIQRTDKMRAAGIRLYESAPEETVAFVSARASLPTKKLARFQSWAIRLQAAAPNEFKQLEDAHTESKSEVALAELHKVAPAETEGWWNALQDLYETHPDEMDTYFLTFDLLYEAAPEEMDAFAEAEIEAMHQSEASWIQGEIP
ncbi:MAG: hypothetical protein OXG59_11825 [Gammaproteobacteria bacterium]|nr:hypothetical protein [Gammaproteobacteria bacterium]